MDQKANFKMSPGVPKVFKNDYSSTKVHLIKPKLFLVEIRTKYLIYLVI